MKSKFRDSDETRTKLVTGIKPAGITQRKILSEQDRSQPDGQHRGLTYGAKQSTDRYIHRSRRESASTDRPNHQCAVMALGLLGDVP